MLKQRLEDLKKQRDQLQINLEEINFLIQGYENTIKAQEDSAGTSDEAEASEDWESPGGRMEKARVEVVRKTRA